MKTVGFIGVGELALYTINGVRRGGYQGSIMLSPRNRQKAADLAQRHACEVLGDNQAVVSKSDFVVISTRPAQCLETLSSLEFRPGQVLISVVAGIEIEQLRSALNLDIEIIRAMPVSSAEAASSPTLVYPLNDFVCEFFDYCGQSIAVDNEQTFDQGSVLACVYSWYFVLFESLIEATRSSTLPKELAAQLVMGMAKGAADLALADRARSPGEIATGIATEGTFSKLGLELLEENQAFAPWRLACELLKAKLAD
jgi:pyrroline-5-carboxylate reductase